MQSFNVPFCCDYQLTLQPSIQIQVATKEGALKKGVRIGVFIRLSILAIFQDVTGLAAQYLTDPAQRLEADALDLPGLQ